MDNLKKWFEATYKGIWDADKVINDPLVMSAWADHLVAKVSKTHPMSQSAANMSEYANMAAQDGSQASYVWSDAFKPKF